MGETFFVTLPNNNLTLNVASIILVSWDQVPKEWARAGYIATVQLVSRHCIYLDGEDAFILQNAIHEYNQRQGHDPRQSRTAASSVRTAPQEGWNQMMKGKAVKQGA